jgi:hypothetical protein
MRTTMTMRSGALFAVLSAATLWACGGDEPSGDCDPAAQTGCKDGLVCEVVSGGEPACFAPVIARGDVFDLGDGSAIEGARIVALDLNGAPVSSVAVSGRDGSYELAIPSARDAEGNPTIPSITLRADGAGYQSFPGGLRQSLPVDVTSPIDEDGKLVIESSLTRIGLIGLPEAAAGVIAGSIELPGGTVGVLVVAEDGDGKGYSAIADRTGDYAIFNLPDGPYQVTAYARGHNYQPGEATVAGNRVGLDLGLSDQAASTVSGRVEIVDPGTGTATSVILVLESTFNEALGRGESPPGLRAPDPGLVPDVTGEFSITGVPAGRYVALAAFENDDLVRDPDSCIAGTGFVRQAVGHDETVAIAQSFKVTGALAVTSPGATSAELVSGTPTFRWVDDASEDAYRLIVLDSFGQTVWETEVAGSVGTNPVVEYGGDPLEVGMYYQFRVTSIRTSGISECELSQTEDLEGVFVVQ